jgi:glucose/arabinose dehydrogenase
MRTLLISLVALIAIGVGGYFGYQYIKEKPPNWLIALVTHRAPPPPLPAADIAPLKAPDGFVATIFARDVKGARVMIRDQKGTMLVSETSEGKVVALPDKNGDGKADSTIVVLQGLDQPHGLLVNCPDASACILYVAETGALKSYRYDADTYAAAYQGTLANFPTGNGHFTRTLQMDPDGKHILISIGSSCNVCTESNKVRASVQSFDLTTQKVTPFATGLRNTVFMAIDP